MLLNGLNVLGGAKANSVKNTVKQEIKEKTLTTVPFEQKSSSDAVSGYFKAAQLLSFKGYPCSKAGFLVKRQKNIPCACCGQKMFTSDGIKDFVKEVESQKGKDLSKTLEENMGYFRGIERAVAKFLIKTSSKSPDLGMSELLQKYSPNAKVLMETEQKSVMDRIDEKAKSILGEKNVVSDCVNEAIKQIDNGTKDNTFLRKPFLANLVETLKQVEDKELAGQMLDIAVQLPTSKNTLESFIVKYSQKNNFEIARRLAQTGISTAEHIHPDSMGGPDDTSNYMAECAHCNSHRGTTDLEEWMKEYPNMPRSVQRNIDEVTERIINGDLGTKYEDYPTDLQKTVDTETRGIIKLKVKNSEEIEAERKKRGLPNPAPSPKLAFPKNVTFVRVPDTK